MPSVTGLIQRCAGADFNNSSDDLVATGSATTQKQLLRRGNNFYTVDRSSVEAVTARIHEELFDLEKAPDDLQDNDATAMEDRLRPVSGIPGDTEALSQKDGEIATHMVSGEDLGDRAPAPPELSRSRIPQFKNQATNMAALLYNSRVGGRPKKVEISHDPPREPAEARLTYRDEYNILHEVTVTDIPQPRVGPFHSGHGVRPTVLRAITEADSRRTSRLTSGEYASPVYSPATPSPGFILDDSAVAESGSPQMVSTASQTDLFEPHNLSPIDSHSSSPVGRRILTSDRPSLSSRSISTQTDQQSMPSLASRTSSTTGNAVLLSPMVLSRTASTHTEDSELLPSPLMPSPGELSAESRAAELAAPLAAIHTTESTSSQRETRIAATQVDESDALPLSPKMMHGRSLTEQNLKRLSSTPIVTQHTSTQTVDSDLPVGSPLSLASPLYSPIASPLSETSFVGLAALPSIALTAGTQTDDVDSAYASPLSSRRSSSTQTVGFLGLDSKRRLGI